MSVAISRRPSVVALSAVSALASLPAQAEPDDIVARPLVLDPDALDLRLTASINLDLRSIGRPVSLAPDAWWGVSLRWTIGLIHSDASLDQVATSTSFCVRESVLSTCDHLYQGSGIDVRFSALSGRFAIAPRLRVLVRNIEPFKPAVALGTLMRWTHGRFAVLSDPYIRLPLANHNLGNRAAVVLPLWFSVQPALGWMIALHTGFDSDFVVLRDGGHGPVAFDVIMRVSDGVDLSIEAGWGSLFGPQQNVRHGTLMIAAGWHD